MIAIQLADLFTSEPPKAELREKFNQAASAISHSFTIKLTAEDEQYLYIRYKKLKHDTGKLISPTIFNLIFLRTNRVSETTLFDLRFLCITFWL
jgi:hypothetical protein